MNIGQQFSVVLDFSLVDGTECSGATWMGNVKRDLQWAGFQPEVTWNDIKVVHAGWVRVGSLEMGILML